MDDLVQLDKDVLKFLNSYDLLSRILKVLEEHQLDESAYKKVAPIIDRIVDAPQNMSRLPSEIGKVLNLNQAKAKRLATDLAGFWLLPLEAHLGDVSGLIVKWGGDLSRYPKDTVAKKSINPMQFTRETLSTLGVKMEEPAMKNRLEYVLSTLVRGVRTPDDAKRVMVRGKKVGGLEMSKEEADKLVDHFVAKMENVEIDRGPAVPVDGVETKKAPPVKEKPRPEAVKEIQKLKKTVKTKKREEDEKKKKPEPTPKKSQLEVKSKASFSVETFSDEDETEVKAAAKKIAKAPSSPVSIEKTVDKVIKEAGIKFKTLEGEKRFRKIVETRLRDVRDALETRDILEDKVEQGGLGLQGARLADVIELIERAYNDHASKLGEQKAKEKQKYLQKRKEAESGKADLARAEADVLAKRYASLTGKAPSHLVTPAAPTAAKVSASRGSETDLKEAASKIDQDKVKRVMAKPSQPAQADAHLSAASVAKQSGQRPQVQDVARARKLVGPIDELGNMNTVSFRRLSSDPDEAVLKIRDKIELLEADSYAKRLKGIKAWQQSPLYKLYLQVMRESLVRGLQVKDIAGEIGSAEQALKPEEVQSIRKLNKQLKF